MSRTSLTKYAPLMREKQPEEAFEMCRHAFHHEGIICISLKDIEERCGWVAARSARNLGEQIFGRKR